MTDNDIAREVVRAALEVHRELGPDLLENAYKECLAYTLDSYGLLVEKEKPLPLIFRQIKLECGYRADILVQKKVIVEVKSVEALNDIHLAQVLTYLKIGDFRLGLLINFNVTLLKQGLKRVIYGNLYE